MNGETPKIKRVYLQPTPVRIWHWLNAFGILALGASGVQIRFPEFVSLFGSYKSAIMLHNTAGILVAVSFSFWFFYYTLIVHKMARLYVPNRDDLENGLARQAGFYFFRYFLGEANPHHPSPDDKFNPLQKSAYMLIMFVLVPLVSLSGILLMNVAPLRDMVVLIGGLKFLVVLHFLLACALFAFLFTHVYLATLGRTPLAYLKPMWTGWEEEMEEH